MLGKIASSANFAFALVYGDYMKMNKLTIFEPGNGFFSNDGHLVIKPATPGDINSMLAGLTNGNQKGNGGTQGGTGSPGSGHYSETAATGNNALQQLITDANATGIQSELQQQLNAHTLPSPAAISTSSPAPASLSNPEPGISTTPIVTPPISADTKGLGWGVGGTPPCPSCGTGPPPGQH